jgi:hypothetical protein
VPAHAARIRILPDCDTRLIQIKLELKRLVFRIDFLDEAGRNEFNALGTIGRRVNIPYTTRRDKKYNNLGMWPHGCLISQRSAKTKREAVVLHDGLPAGSSNHRLTFCGRASSASPE